MVADLELIIGLTCLVFDKICLGTVEQTSKMGKMRLFLMLTKQSEPASPN